jgi:hypothetical protein
MLHGQVLGEELVGVAIQSAFVGVQIGLALDVVGNDLGHGGLGRPIDVEAAGLAATLDQRDRAGPLPRPM